MSKHSLSYWNLLRDIKHRPAWKSYPVEFVALLIDSDYKQYFYKGNTIAEVIIAIKADGWIILGNKLSDYPFPPRNAFEYLLIEHYMKTEGFTDEEIQQRFSLDYDSEGEAVE